MKQILHATIAAMILMMAPAATLYAQFPAETPGMDRIGELIANVNVRAEPDMNGAIIGGLPKSTRVRIYEERQGWIQVSVHTSPRLVRGWVFGKFVLPIEMPSVPVPTIVSASPADPPEEPARMEVRAPHEPSALPSALPFYAGDPALVDAPTAAPPSDPVEMLPDANRTGLAPPKASAPTPPPALRTPPHRTWIGVWLARGVMLAASMLAFVLAVGQSRRRSDLAPAATDLGHVNGHLV